MIVLAVDVEKKLGTFKLAVRFEAAGGATALFGPSGAGKTTVVNMIAGLLTPDRGSIALNGTTLFDAAAGINVPPHRRHIGYVFQEGRLFPHLSVRQNIDYGRRMSGQPRDVEEFARIVELLDIGPLLDRRPRLLSGGERQRVAIGRALLMRPRLLAARRAAGVARFRPQARNSSLSGPPARRGGSADGLCQPHGCGSAPDRHECRADRSRPRDGSGRS